MSEIVVASNRGPVSFAFGPDGGLVTRHAAGGLAPSLARALRSSDALWLAATMNDAERAAAAGGVTPEATGDIDVAFVEVSAETAASAYRVVANSTLWFLNHGLFDAPRRPVFDRRWHRAWEGYRRYNAAFAEAVAGRAASGATVFVNDYHLFLVGAELATLRPDLKTVHFTHTPFCTPDELEMLPGAVAAELVGALCSYGAVGFHTPRWSSAFRDCAEALGIEAPDVFDAALGTDSADLLAVSASPAVAAHRERLTSWLDGRQLVLRSDRVELSKNIVRGFLAFEELLEDDPGLVDRVVFLARAYLSREDLPEYLAYRNEIEHVVARVNERFGTPQRQPIALELGDDFEASVAALGCYDVLLVNPVRDGMNLVAKEGPVVNRNDGVVLLSRQAGAFAELADHVIPVDPFDVSGTAEAIGAALALEPGERAERAKRLADLASAHSPAEWFADVVAHATRSAGRR